MLHAKNLSQTCFVLVPVIGLIVVSFTSASLRQQEEVLASESLLDAVFVDRRRMCPKHPFP